MGRNNNQIVFYGLLFFQGMISFILGIAGNKVAEITNISIGILLIGTILLLGVSFGISVVLLRKEPKKDDLNQTHQLHTQEGFIGSILSRVITSFPFGIFVGLVLTAILIYTVWIPSITINLLPDSQRQPGFWIYELLSWFILVISAYLINQHKLDRAIVLAYSLGFAIGASSAIMVLDNEYNNPFATFLGWLFVSFVTALATKSSTIKGIAADVNEMVTNITAKR